MPVDVTSGNLLNGQYRITKALGGDPHGRTFVATDVQIPDRSLVIEEMVPDAALPEDALAKRRLHLREMIWLINNLDHPVFCKLIATFSEGGREYLVREHVEGVTFEALSRMSMNSLPEKQVLEWALLLCQAMAYLHNRPRPLVLDSLAPGHFVLTHEGQVKMVDYGLARIFSQAEPPEMCGGSSLDAGADLASFGRLLAFLLTRRFPDGAGGSLDNALRPDLSRVVGKCLRGGSADGYRDFERVEEDLFLLLQPPPPSEPLKVETTPEKGRERGTGGVLRRWLALPPRLRWAAVAGLSLALGLTWWLASSASPSSTGPVGYLLSGGSKMLVVAGNRVVDRASLGFEATDVAGDAAGNRLFLSDAAGSRIWTLDARTHRPPEGSEGITVERAPTRIVADDSGAAIFSLHPEAGKVSRIDLTCTPPRVSALLSAGKAPSGLALSPGGRLLFVSSAIDKTISILQSDGTRSFGTLELGATPMAMACSPDSRELWVACQDPDSVVVVDLKSFSVSGTLSDTGGSRPVDVAMNVDGSRVLVLNQGSGNVGMLTRTSRKCAGTIAVGSKPQRLLLTPAGDQVWVTSTGSDSVDLIDLRTEARCGTVEVGAPVGMGTVLR